MIKLTFKYEKTYNFIVDKAKYVYNDDISQYWTLKRAINSIIYKTSKSEYAQENNRSIIFNINDECITKYDDIFLVNPSFDIDEDAKLGTKSLMLRYLLSKQYDIDIKEDFFQVKSILNYFADILSDDNISVQISESLNKLICKLMVVNYLKDDYYANKNDMDYEELICFQLYLIDKFKDLSKRTIIFVELPFLTNKIKRIIDAMDKCYIIIIFNNVSNELLFENNIVVNTLDLEDDEKMYERMITMSNYYNLDEYRKKIKNEFLNKLFK